MHLLNLLLQLANLCRLLSIVVRRRVLLVRIGDSLLELLEVNSLLLVLFDYFIRLLLHLLNM